jgi:hypothetical protein
LNIYAHILKQYYPGDVVLSLSGRDCLPVKNPFNDNRPTLKIAIVNNLAVHVDSHNAQKGDAFSFAARHYKVEGEALFNKLNEAMHLHIGESFDGYNRDGVIIRQPSTVEKNPIPCFSFFKSPVTNTIPHSKLNVVEVYQLIKAESYKSATQLLRNIKEVKEAKKYKATHFDYVTFSGTFTKRNDNSMEKHSGLLTVDFDDLPDPLVLKEQLLNDEYFETELLFLSPSGNGLKWILEIDLSKAAHLDYFKGISNYILHTYRLKIDPSGKDLSRACFLPHDPNIYINPKYA